jgi:MFS family permease
MAAPTQSVARAPATGDRRRWVVVVLLFTGMLVNYVDRGNLSIVAAPLMRDFQIDPLLMGTLLSAFLWTYATLQIPAGYLVDRFGIKWSYACGFVIWSVASTAMGFAHSYQQLFGLRLLLGVGEAVSPVASLAYIRQNFPEHQQGLPTAIYVSGMTLGPSVGALLGGILLGHQGWRMLFIVTGLGALVWLIPWSLLTPSSPRRAAGVRLPPAPALPWKVLVTMPTFWGITVGSFFYSYFSYFCLTWIPAYLVMDKGYSFLKMGTFTAVPWLGTILVSFISARAADRIIGRQGNAMSVRRGFVSTGFIVGSSILALLVARSSAAVLASLLLSLLGIGLASSNFWALTEAVTPAPIAGRFIGYQNMIASIGGMLAPVLTGLIMSRTKSFNLAIIFAGGALLVAASIYLTLLREKDVKALGALFPTSHSL